MPATPIRVLLVDDSPLALLLLRRLLASAPDIAVVGEARSGAEALRLIPQLRPSVVCTDYQMPEMDGLALTREVMARFPCPILVVSAVVSDRDSREAFALLQAGAVEIFPKPAGGAEAEAAAQLAQKIRVVAGVYVFPRAAAPATVPAAAPRPRPIIAGARVRIVGIGASTGGPQALQTVLAALPADFPVPLLCVQHISRGFLKGMVEWLAAQCRLKVRLASPGEPPSPGTVYFPEEETHLTVDAQGRLRSSREPPVENQRPAVTVTFQSLARCFGAGAAAVLLTGMGRDGAEGMAAVAGAGGLTIAQDEATSAVWGMPRAAVELCAARHVLPLGEIAGALCQAVGRRGGE